MKTATNILAVVLCLVVIVLGLGLSSIGISEPAPVNNAPPQPIQAERPAPSEIDVVPSNPEQTAEPAAPETAAPETTPAPEATPETAAPEATPETTPEPTAEPVLDDTPLDPSFFDDAAFIGDSVSGVLEYFASNKEGLGKAQFFVTVEYSVQAAVDGSKQVYYQGRGMKPEDALKAAGVKKVFIMLGALGDLPYRTISETLMNWELLIDNIREKNPDIQIFIQSCTPVAYDVPKINNAMIDEYNAKLKDFADQNGCVYVEIGKHFQDTSGKLPFEHCRDGYSSLRIDSADYWVELLRDPANYSVNPHSSASVSSQAVKEQSFSVEGMTITLTNEFTQINMAGFTAAFDAPDVALLALKESFAAAPGAEALSLDEYIDIVIQANGIQGAEKKNPEGLSGYSYSFTNPQDGKTYRYLSFAYKTGDAFWLLQFVTAEESAGNYEAKIVGWAKTARFA